MRSWEAHIIHVIKQTPAQFYAEISELCALFGFHLLSDLLKNQALAYFERALELERDLGAGGVKLANTLNNVGYASQLLNDLDQAEAYLLDALELYNQQINGSAEMAATLENLGSIRLLKEDLSKAESYLQQALTIRESVFGGKGAEVAASHSALGQLYFFRGERLLAEGRTEQSIDNFEDALSHFDISLKSRELLNDLNVAQYLNNMGGASLHLKKYGDAKSYFEEALNIFIVQLGPNHLRTAELHHNLGVLYLQLQDWEQSKEKLLQALDIREEYLGKRHSDTKITSRQLKLVNDMISKSYLNSGGFTEGYALLVGVGTYRNAKQHNVPVTAKDAEAVEKTLTNVNLCGYPADQVTLVKEEKATCSNILTELAKLAERTQEESTVFLYFCGHGAFGIDGNWYFTAHDTQFVDHNGQPRVNLETAIGEKVLIERIRAIPARKKFIVFNTCYSGEMSQVLSLDPHPYLESKNPNQNLTFALLEEGQENVVVTASASSQLSYIRGINNNTIFTNALIDALKGNGVVNNNGFIGAFNLYSAIYEDVMERAENLFGVKQEPEITVLKAVGSMPIALFRGADAGSLSLDGFQSENDPENGLVHSVTPKRATRAYINHFGAGGTQYNIETVQGDFVGGDQFTGDKYSAGGDMTFDQRDIKTEGGAFIGGNVSTESGDVIGRDSYSIGDVGSNSTISQGSGSTAVGSGGVYVGGSNSGNIVTGDNNTIGDRNVNIGGNVGSGSAIGRGASVQAQNIADGNINSAGSNPNEIAAAFAVIQQAIVGSNAISAMKTVAEQTLAALKSEASKGENANEVVVESLMGTLITMLPDIAEVVITTFLKPVKGLGLVFQKVAQKMKKG